MRLNCCLPFSSPAYVAWIFYSFWADFLLNWTRIRHFEGDWCILHPQHLSVVPTEPSYLNWSNIFSVSQPCVFLLLTPWAQHVPAVSGLCVLIERPLAYRKQFQLIDWMSGRLDGHSLGKILLNCEASVSRYIWVMLGRRQWLYVRTPIPLVFWYIMTQSYDDCTFVTFNVPICLWWWAFVVSFFTSEKRPRAVKSFLTNFGSLFVNMYEYIRSCTTELFKNIVATYVKLILVVRISPIDLETMSGIIKIYWFPLWSSLVALKYQWPRTKRVEQLQKAEASACASEIHSGCMSDICVQVCTHHSPCTAIGIFVTQCPTYVSTCVSCK